MIEIVIGVIGAVIGTVIVAGMMDADMDRTFGDKPKIRIGHIIFFPYFIGYYGYRLLSIRIR